MKFIKKQRWFFCFLLKKFCLLFFLLFLFFKSSLISNVKYYLNNLNFFFSNRKHDFSFLFKQNGVYLSPFINKVYRDNLSLKKKIYIIRMKLLFLNRLIYQNNIYRKFLFLPVNKLSDYVLVKVISSGLFNRDHVYIDKGSVDKVSLGKLLFNYDGLVGHIVLVKNNVSKVKLICSLNNVLLVKILRNGISFLMSGNGCSNSMSINDLPLNLDIKIGDIIVTYDINSFYPFGYPVAMVNNIYWDESCLCKVVTVKSFVKFDSLNYLVMFN